MKAILGIKIGMTRVFNKDSKIVPVTIIESGPCLVTQIKKTDKDGYNAVQIAYSKSKKNPKILREFHILPEDKEEIKKGDEIKADIFKINDIVDITGVTKGKGFAGTTKRHGFHLGPKSHGSNNYRRPGSIGNRFPQRVVKGKKMPGHMGTETNTIKNLPIIDINLEKNLISVRGSVPGPNKSYLFIRGR